MPRSEVLALDLHTNDRTGVNTNTNGKKLELIHAARLAELGRVREVYEDGPDRAAYEADDLIVDWVHLCDSYENPAAHCVYDEEDHGDYCVYCGQPLVRQ